MNDDLLRSIDARLGRIEGAVTEIVADMVTQAECRDRHNGGRDTGFRLVMALVAVAAVIVAIVK